MSVETNLKNARAALFTLFSEEKEAPEDRGRAFVTIVEDCSMYCERLGFDPDLDDEEVEGGADEGDGLPDQASRRDLPGPGEAGDLGLEGEGLAEPEGDEEAPDGW